MNKLFEIPPQKRTFTLYLQTYKGNKIVTKLISLLREFSKFEIKSVEGIDENRIFEISIFSDKETDIIVKELKKEIVTIMGVHFPDNYLFDFTERKLGYVNSFNVFSGDGFHFEVCHKIKEVRTDGGTHIPKKQIII